MEALVKLLLGGDSAFVRNFRRNEYAAMARRGKGHTLVWLSLIVGTTLAALAFGVGSLDQLRERMDNPFTNIVDKGIHISERAAFSRVRKQLLATPVADRMGLDTITDWSVYVLNVFPKEVRISESGKEVMSLRGRTVDYNSSLFNYVFTAENVRYGADFRGADFAAANRLETGGIIIKATVLEELGYTKSQISEIKALPVFQNSIQAVFMLPVLAIVTNLPSNADFVSSKDFYLSIFGDNCANASLIVNREGDNNLRFVVPAAEVESFTATVKNIIDDASADLEVEQERVALDGVRDFYVITLSIRVPYVRARTDFYGGLLAEIKHQQSNTGWLPFTRYVRTNEPCTKAGAQQASFVFKQLGSIRDFRAFLLEESDIDLPIEVVENKENFAMVSLLGKSMGLMLALFALASICFFIRNLIEGHLNNVKPNLGTFKAFGMPNADLVRHYQRILVCLLSLALLFGALLAVVLGGLIHVAIGPGQFNLANTWVLGAILVIFIFSLLYSRRIVQRILSRTPGDLVYGRA